MGTEQKYSVGFDCYIGQLNEGNVGEQRKFYIISKTGNCPQGGFYWRDLRKAPELSEVFLMHECLALDGRNSITVSVERYSEILADLEKIEDERAWAFADKSIEACEPKPEATKHDSQKPRTDLLPFEALEEVSKVLAHGASKYADHNWRKGMAWSRLLGASLRHLFSWAKGEDLDEESGLSHLAHAACCILFLISYTLNGSGTDDRYKGEK